jgi:hypothetical protein
MIASRDERQNGLPKGSPHSLDLEKWKGGGPREVFDMAWKIAIYAPQIGLIINFSAAKKGCLPQSGVKSKERPLGPTRKKSEEGKKGVAPVRPGKRKGGSGEPQRSMPEPMVWHDKEAICLNPFDSIKLAGPKCCNWKR